MKKLIIIVVFQCIAISREVIEHLVDIVKEISPRYIQRLYLKAFDYSKAYDNLCKNC